MATVWVEIFFQNCGGENLHSEGWQQCHGVPNSTNHSESFLDLCTIYVSSYAYVFWLETLKKDVTPGHNSYALSYILDSRNLSWHLWIIVWTYSLGSEAEIFTTGFFHFCLFNSRQRNVEYLLVADIRLVDCLEKNNNIASMCLQC